ncbi:MAG: protein kinase [Pirellulaceae bacterium]
MNDREKLPNESEQDFARRLVELHEKIKMGETPAPSTGQNAGTESLTELLAFMEQVRQIDPTLLVPDGTEAETQPDKLHLPQKLNAVDTAPTSMNDTPAELPSIDVTTSSEGETEATLPTTASNLSVVQLGRFQIQELIGKGGFGVIYAAYDSQLERRVAIKIPKPEALLSSTLRKRFLREGRAAACLSHPNIVAVYEVGKQGPICFMATELIDGPNLNRWTRDRSFDSKSAAQIMVQIADAIQHAHSRGILHRDLKPANILMDGEVPKVTDFGLAQRLEEIGDELSANTDILGTPAFMSPEQATGNRELIDFRTDVYGLGTVLYFLLTGQPPFSAGSPIELLDAVRHREPKPPKLLNQQIPLDLQAICLKSLEKSPDHRYSSAHEFQRDLENYLNGLPTRARPIGRYRRLIRWSRRNPVLAAVSAAATLFLIFGLIASSIGWWQTTKALSRESEAKQDAEAQRAETQRRYQQAKDAVDQYYSKVADNQLFDAPGLTLLRQELYEQALSYYQQFLAENEDDDQLRLEMAETHSAIGQILREMGQPGQALNHFQSSLQLHQLVNQKIDDSDSAVAHCQILRRIAAVQFELGNLDEATIALESGLAALDPFITGSNEYQSTVSTYAQLLSQLGRVLHETRQPELAKSHLQRAVKLGEELTVSSPDSAEFARQLIESRQNLAVVQRSMGQVPAAEQLAIDNVAAAKAILAHDRANFSDQDGLAKCLYNRARYQLMRGGFSEAIDGLQEARNIYEGLTIVFPNTSVYHRQKANVSTAFAIALAETGALETACTEFEAAEAALKQAIELDSNAAEVKSDLASVSSNYGTVLADKLGRLPEAKERFLAVREIFQELLDETPNSVTNLRGLISCNVNLAGITESSGDHPMALDYANKALDELADLLQQQPDNPQVIYLHRQALWNRASAFDGLDRYSESISDWNEMLLNCPPGQQTAVKMRLAATLTKNGELAQAIGMVYQNDSSEVVDPKGAFYCGQACSLIAKALDQMEAEDHNILVAEVNALLVAQVDLKSGTFAPLEELSPVEWELKAMDSLEAAANAGFFNHQRNLAMLDSDAFLNLRERDDFEGWIDRLSVPSTEK